MKERKPCEPTTVVASVPAQILEDPELSYASKLLFGCIYGLAINFTKCFISNDELARRMCCKRRYVQILLKSLEAKGLIGREFDQETHREQIVVLWQPGAVVIRHRRSRKAVRKPATPAHNLAQGGAQPCAGLRTVGHSPDSLREQTHRDKPPSPPAAGGGGVLDLIDQAKTAGLAGCSEAKAIEALATFPLDAIVQAIAVAKKNDAERWGYVVNVLKHWQADPDSRPKAPKREPPRPYHLPWPGPPPPDPDALPGEEIAANIRAMLGKKAKATP